MKQNLTVVGALAAALGIFAQPCFAQMTLDMGDSLPELTGPLSGRAVCKAEFSSTQEGEQLSLMADFTDYGVMIQLLSLKSKIVVGDETHMTVGQMNLEGPEKNDALISFGIFGGHGGIQFFPILDGSSCRLDAKVNGGKTLSGTLQCQGLTESKDADELVSVTAKDFECDLK